MIKLVYVRAATLAAVLLFAYLAFSIDDVVFEFLACFEMTLLMTAYVFAFPLTEEQRTKLNVEAQEPRFIALDSEVTGICKACALEFYLNCETTDLEASHPAILKHTCEGKI